MGLSNGPQDNRSRGQTLAVPEFKVRQFRNSHTCTTGERQPRRSRSQAMSGAMSPLVSQMTGASAAAITPTSSSSGI